MKSSEDEREFLKNSYFYGIHLLIKEGNLKEAKKKLEKIEKKFKNSPALIREKIEFLEKTNPKKTEKYINFLSNKILFNKEDSISNDTIYEKIGVHYYKKNQYKKAQKYLERKSSINDKNIYSPIFKDIKTDIELLKIHIKNLELLKIEKDVYNIFEDKIYNMRHNSL